MYDDVGVIFYNGIFGHILKKDNSFYIISIENAKLLNLYQKSNNKEEKNLYRNKILKLLQQQKEIYNANEKTIREILENYQKTSKNI